MAEIGSLADLLESKRLVARYSPRICVETEKLAGWELVCGTQLAEQQTFIPLDGCPATPELAKSLWDWQIHTVEEQLPLLIQTSQIPAISAMQIPFISIKAYSSQFESEGWVPQVLNLIRKLSIYPFRLEIEIVQCGDTFNSTIANWSFEALSDAGATLSLGNFPTNPVSFACLGRHKFDLVKISEVMIPDMHDSIAVWAKQREVIKGLIATIKALDAQVVLSGIHREAQLNFFRELDAIQWQGGHWPSASFFAVYERYCMQMGVALPLRPRFTPSSGN